MKNRLCSVVLVVISLMMFASKVTAVQNYTIIDLGILPEHTSSSAHAINDLGQVVGRGDQDRVFLYDDNGIHDLGFHGVPHDINNLGQIVGVATGSKAFLYSLGDLNILFSGNYHYAYGINDLGEVVGHNREVGFLYIIYQKSLMKTPNFITMASITLEKLQAQWLSAILFLSMIVVITSFYIPPDLCKIWVTWGTGIHIII